jgi:hypothetical protein
VPRADTADIAKLLEPLKGGGGADRLLTQYQAAGRGEGRNQVQRRLVVAAIMAPPQGGLAVNRHQIMRSRATASTPQTSPRQ